MRERWDPSNDVAKNLNSKFKGLLESIAIEMDRLQNSGKQLTTDPVAGPIMKIITNEIGRIGPAYEELKTVSEPEAIKALKEFNGALEHILAQAKTI